MEQSNELKRHIVDLADRCFNREIPVFSDFLSLSEQSEILSIEREISYVDLAWFGGMEGCERKMLMLSPKNSGNGYKVKHKENAESSESTFTTGSNEKLQEMQDTFPIRCLIAKPLMKKFSDDLNHRDFLGALMNLGINREVLGDIVVKENTGYIFCEEKMADYICENLTKIKHTNVKCTVADGCPESAKPTLKQEKHIVQSARCDAVVSKVFNLSRSQSIELFRSKLVFVDGRQCENNSAMLKEEATVSVRGHGKFIFDGISDETRKGKCWISIRKFV